MNILSNLPEIKFFTPKELEQLKSLELTTVYDLLTYFPHKYAEEAQYVNIKDARDKQEVLLIGTISQLENSEDKFGYKKVGVPYTRFKLSDGTGMVQATFWNMPYIKKIMKDGEKVCLTGTISTEGNLKVLNSPKLIRDKKMVQNIFAKVELHNSLFDNRDKPLTPIYKETKTVKSATIKRCLFKIFNHPDFQNLVGYLPEDIENSLALPTFKNAVLMRHNPKDTKAVDVSKKYFAFQEIFLIQTYREREKFFKKDCLSYIIKPSQKIAKSHLALLPFKLTKGQSNVMDSITADMESRHPMSRLVEGDVGSGKTALALLSSLLCIETTVKVGKLEKRLQAAIMAPTEVLASQHFETFTKTLKDFCLENNLHIALLAKNTGKIFPSKIDRNRPTTFPKNKIKQYLEEGKVDILIGTHSVIQKSVKFSRLGLLIIDEQHRFGIKQRLNLLERAHSKNQSTHPSLCKEGSGVISPLIDKEGLGEVKIPHLLSLSATPIPRTLALTIYGDLDLSILDELPPGRKRAKTELTPPSQRDKMYKTLEDYLKKGKQAYIICSKVEPSDEEDLGEEVGSAVSKVKNVKDEFVAIKKKFPDYEVGLLYGSQPKVEKEKVLEKFYNNEINILVATSVVEVGVSVPNATAIIIENAERFGLSQLHQLRGRVERSSEESVCFLCINGEDKEISKRLEALAKTESGFELAEVDLAERGAGALIGKRQSGLTDTGMEAIKNRKLVELAKQKAQELIAKDPNLQKHLLLSDFLNTLEYHGE